MTNIWNYGKISFSFKSRICGHLDGFEESDKEHSESLRPVQDLIMGAKTAMILVLQRLQRLDHL